MTQAKFGFMPLFLKILVKLAINLIFLKSVTLILDESFCKSVTQFVKFGYVFLKEINQSPVADGRDYFHLPCTFKSLLPNIYHDITISQKCLSV